MKIGFFLLNKIMKKIAICIPCYNEEMSIKDLVIKCFVAFPESRVIVFDNSSKDKTAQEAIAGGAEIVFSPKKGKGNVVKHIFQTIKADCYIILDGDGTYDPLEMKKMYQAFLNNDADMVIGNRLSTTTPNAFPQFHLLGNKLISTILSRVYGAQISDVLSGARILSRDFVKSVYLRYGHFEVETELTIQAILKHMNIIEIPIEYGKRMPGSFSKLRTWSDGFFILKSILDLFKDNRPFLFYGCISVFFLISSLTAGFLPIRDYVEYNYVYHVPLAILAASLAVLSLISFSIGTTLATLYHYHIEVFEREAMKSDE